MTGMIIIAIAVLGYVFWYLGETEPRRRLRDAAMFLYGLDLVIIGLVVANIVAGGRP